MNLNPASLPIPQTAFIGREHELREIAGLLSDPNCRLLTIVGPGGIGKTRLAIQAAAGQSSQFADGSWFVGLETLNSSEFIPVAIAEALNIPFYSPEDPLTFVSGYLQDRQVLLVVDNCEHLLEGIDCLVKLLKTAPGLKILATSRERLNLREEWLFTLEGLSYPGDPSTDSAANYSAVRLFFERARQVQHRFALEDHLPCVLTICRKAEGLPLGLELAASWLRVMTCEQIAAQMEAQTVVQAWNTLDFLASTARNIPERHRSLRQVLEQSWRMLSADGQAALMQLSVFRGGFDLEAASHVAGASLTTLAALADRSLLRLGANGRYSLHEVLRQYAQEKLVAQGENRAAMQRHLAYFVQLAKSGEVSAYGREQLAWFERMEVELDNLRAALAWALADHQIELGLRLAAALRLAWEMRGHLPEGLDWFKKLLPGSSEVPPSIRSKALHRAAELAGQLADDAQAASWAQEALRLARKNDDPWNTAWSLSTAAFFTEQNLEQAAAMLEESLALFQQLNDPFGLSHARRRLAGCAINQHKFDDAASLIEQALAADRSIGDRNAIAWELCFLGIARWSRDHQAEQVIPLYQESLALFQEMKDIRGKAHALAMLADVERAKGDPAQSLENYQETLRIERDLGIRTDLTVIAIAGIASLSTARGNLDRAARLLGAVHAALETGTYSSRFPPLVEVYDSTLSALHAQLPEEPFSTAWTSGSSLPLEQAVIEALQYEPETSAAAETQKENQPALPELLSSRELEIVRLLGTGLSNTEIAQQLYISPATVKVHTRSIYRKLNVSNRTQAVMEAQKHQLL